MKLTRHLLFAAIFSLAPVVCRAEPLRQWEYKVLAYNSAVQEIERQTLASGVDEKKLEDPVARKIEEMLNKLGTEGWELVTSSDGAFVFKRPKAN